MKRRMHRLGARLGLGGRHSSAERAEDDNVSHGGGESKSVVRHGSGSAHRALKEEQFSGIAKIELTSIDRGPVVLVVIVDLEELELNNRMSILSAGLKCPNFKRVLQAQMKFKDKWFACVSLGEQTFRTVTSIHTDKPEWKSVRSMVLEADGPRIVRVSVFETNRISKNNLVGYCEIDLSHIFTSENDHKDEVHDLLDPNSTSRIVGTITLGYSAETRMETEMHFARRLLSIVDYDESGELSLKELRVLIKAFGNTLSGSKLEAIFKKADTNQDGKVSADELAALLATSEERTFLVKTCPVCGEKLGSNDLLNDMIHMSLCFDEGTGNQIMTGGFLTEKQAANGWMFKLSEWASHSTYDVGKANAGHILVFDRISKRLVEELIDVKIVLAMRAIYQSRMGLALIDIGTKNMLQSMSKKQGLRMRTAESKNDIPKFIEFFQDRINVDEFKEPIEYYKTFNDFFIRELKPGVRPIAFEDNDAVAVSAADCRLMAFNSPDDATRFWIKGQKFSVAGLLTKPLYKDFEGGPMVIFRLAPQDYHRFHVPVSGIIIKMIDVPGQLYTVNPIAVTSKYCNVFTENKRAVCIIETKEFGKVAMVAIGATMVGSITFSKKEGDVVKKGEQMGFFSFGGSTTICVFQKGSIDLDEDLIINSTRRLETLVFMGMSIGVAQGRTYEDMEHVQRPSITDSVAAQDHEMARKEFNQDVDSNHWTNLPLGT